MALWFITGFAFLIVPQRLGRFDGADDPNLVTFYEVADNARYLTQTEVRIFMSLVIAFASVTIMLVLSMWWCSRKEKVVQPSPVGDVAKSAAPEE